MAGFVNKSKPTRQTRQNPDLLGEDLGRVAWMAVGAGLAGTINDKFVAPFVGKLMPGIFTGTVGKLADGLTTMVTGYGLGKGIGMVSRSVAHQVKTGAFVLGAAKVLGVVLPINLSAGVTVPSGFGIFAAPAPVKAVTNGNGNAILPAGVRSIAVDQTGL
jgi:hypothetical protein